MREKLPYRGQRSFCLSRTRHLLILFVLAACSQFVNAQALIPAAQGGFENGTSTFAANGWTEKQTTATRKFYVGTPGGANSGTKAAYVGSTTNNNGSNSTTVMHFYRDVAIPALTGGQQANLSFWVKMPTVDSGYDYFDVMYTTTANTPVAGTFVQYNNLFSNTSTAIPNWTKVGPINMSALAGTTVRIVVSFESDGNTPHANPAIDDFDLTVAVPLPTTQCATLTAPANGATNVGANGNLVLSWTAPASGPVPTSYDLYVGTTAGNPAFLANYTTTSVNLTGFAINTTYYWKIVPKSPSGTDPTNCAVQSFTTGNPFLPYCYSGITYTGNVEPITSVDFAGINRTSSATVGGSPALENYIADVANVTTESTYTLTLKGNSDGSFTNNFRVFFDWNHDGDMTDPGEVIDAGSITGSTGTDSKTAVTSITIPATALAGTTRMRVKKLWSGDSNFSNIDNPCVGGQYGQTEDYTINVALCPGQITWYRDADNDGFGNAAVTTVGCAQPTGYVSNSGDCDDATVRYADVDGDGFGSQTVKVGCGGVTNNSDCNDNQLQYVDGDSDGFGSTTLAACGVTNNSDCNDAQLQYVDADGDGFGSTTLAACGVTNNSDCNDNQLQYVDADGDSFGSTTLAACGVTNNSDCNDAQLQYVDADGDGFGSTTLAACGVTNNSDCNDAQLQYVDADGDGFGSTTLAACGVTNNSDCNDAQLQYVDADADGFGSTTLAACGVTNNSDCNDNQLQYVDADADGFGSTTLAACGVTNNSDCNDAQLQYVDADADGFGSTTLAACGVTNNSDCNDNQLQYVDADADGFGSTTLAACGVTNNSDCNDAQLQYVDADADGFGSTTLAACGVTNNSDCDDNQLQYVDADADGFGSTTLAACGVTNSSDCDDSQVRYADADGDGFGSLIKVACGGVTNNADCNDADAAIYQSLSFYLDADSDGYGAGLPQAVCAGSTTPAGYSTNNNDCDDTKASVHPGAAEVGYNLIDDDCDGLIDEGFPPKTSTITGTQCDRTLQQIDTQIYADIVAGAQGYQWRVTTMSGPTAGQVQYLNTPLRAMRLVQLANYAFATTYKIEVAVFYAGYLQPYTASACTVTTPATTTTLLSCGQLLTSMSNVIYANNVPYATGYRFRISDGINTTVLDRSLREFRMNLITDFQPKFNKQYTVEVAIRNTTGEYLGYGAPCTVNTPLFPTTFIQDSQCEDYQPATMNTLIYANSYPGAIAYVFKLMGPGLPAAGLEVSRPTRAFKLSDFTGLIPSATYTVFVRLVFNTNDPVGPTGKPCTVVVPGPLRLAQAPFNVLAYPNPFETGFMLNVSTSAQEKLQVKVYDMTGRMLDERSVEVSDLESIAIGENFPSGVYNVVVSQGDDVKTLRVVKR